MEIPEGFCPADNLKYVSNQPHLTVTGFVHHNPLITKLLIEVDRQLRSAPNVLAKKQVSLLEMPKSGMFYQSPLNGIVK